MEVTAVVLIHGGEHTVFLINLCLKTVRLWNDICHKKLGQYNSVMLRVNPTLLICCNPSIYATPGHWNTLLLGQEFLWQSEICVGNKVSPINILCTNYNAFCATTNHDYKLLVYYGTLQYNPVCQLPKIVNWTTMFFKVKNHTISLSIVIYIVLSISSRFVKCMKIYN